MKKRFLTVLLALNFLMTGTFLKTGAQVNKTDTPVSESLHSVACIFAGREKYMSILMPYLKKLQKDGKLTEIHLWQFTNKEDDIKYLESISNIHKTSKNFTMYRTITPKIKNNEFDLKKKAGNDAHILINNTYEIVLGGWGNSKSAIRKGIQGQIISEAPIKTLDENEFKDFTIGIKNQTLYVKNLMGLKIEDDKINSIQIHTGWGSEGYWDYEETQNKNIKLFDTETRVGFSKWGEAYKYYLGYDFDVLLKIDDDIVYMDLDRYDEFVEYMVNNPYNNCIFPNMVNHATSLFYNVRDGLVPLDILKGEYKDKKSANDFYGHYLDGEQAAIIHEYFLSNISKFTKNKMWPINLDNHKESICIFGILKKNYDKIFNPNLKEVTIKDFWGNSFKTSLEHFDDEIYTYNCLHNVMYPRFTAVHYQFGPQMKSGLDEKFLSEYKKLVPREK